MARTSSLRCKSQSCAGADKEVTLAHNSLTTLLQGLFREGRPLQLLLLECGPARHSSPLLASAGFGGGGGSAVGTAGNDSGGTTGAAVAVELAAPAPAGL